MSRSRRAALLENVAAIAAAVHIDRESYDRFYKRFGPSLSGFSGIERLCVSMAHAFTDVSPDWNEYPDTFHAAIDRFVESVLNLTDPEVNLAEPKLLNRLARTAIAPRDPC